MKRSFAGPVKAFGCVCVVLVLMCTFFVAETYAAAVKSGTTTKKEQTIQMKLPKCTCIITVSDADSWVFAQLQTTGNNKLAAAVNGENMVTAVGQKKTFTVQVRKAGTYHLYLHGTNAGAKYSVSTVVTGGTLKSGKARLGTSYANNESVVWYKMPVKKNGQLRVTVKDASYRYPGYSKVQLKKNGKLISGDEHLIKGLGYSTVFGVKPGTYKIGVRTSSELYKLTAKFTAMKIAPYGVNQDKSGTVARKTKAFGVIEPGDSSVRWYKVVLPERSKDEKCTIQIKAENNNRVTAGGIQFVLKYKKSVNGELVTEKKTYLLNNSKQKQQFTPFKGKNRNVYIAVSAQQGASGTYKIYWE